VAPPVASGLLLYLSFPPSKQSLLTWVALVPLLLQLRNLKPLRAVAVSWLAGAVFFGLLLSWIGVFGTLAWTTITLLMAPWTALSGLLSCRLLRGGAWARVFGPPAAWVVLEWLRAQGSLGFAWGQIGVSQAPLYPVVQAASVGGVYLVSFLVVLSSAMVAELATGSRATAVARRQALGAGVALLATALLLGGISAGQTPPPPGASGTVPVLVVQASTRLADGTDAGSADEVMAVHEQLTREATGTEHGRVGLVVWPETAVPASLVDDALLRARALSLAQELGCPLLAGTSAGALADGSSYNSLQVFRPDGRLGVRYDKGHLVPIGEYLPARRLWPWMTSLGVPEVDARRGAPPHPLLIHLRPGRRPSEISVGPLVCFESTFPEIARQETRLGANLLVAATVDSWYGHSAAAEQHLQFSVLRAVENGRFLVRASATGISTMVTPRGKLSSRIELFQRGTALYRPIALSHTTLYTRYGDWVVWLSLATLAALLFADRWPTAPEVMAAH
jgi:apolipoprotein N-acyltransferase